MEVIEYVEDHCPKDCIYRMRFSHTTYFCAYCIAKHELRGCPISQCTRYKGGKRKLILDGELNLRWVLDED